MQCLQCGAEMRLVAATRDETMMVPGYEDQAFECPGCGEREQRRIFRGVNAPAAATGEHIAAELPPSDAPQVELQTLGATGAEAATTQPVTAEAVSAEAVPAEGLSVECVPLEPRPEAMSSESSEPVDEDQELLRRAIAMVRGPGGSSGPLRGLTDGLKTLAALPVMPTAKAARTVQIRHDPSYDAAYAAKDTRSGLVMLRHHDSARLRSMCQRLGWQVVEDGTAAVGE
jgi:hypothetical protein